ncbi:MAG: DUF853 family protein [Bdellovibrionales bacterium]|nr:DUF853 family protein [Bdellovibrionales bacterium]
MTLDFAKSSDGKVISLPLPLANRHGLIAGATGTGKTVTLQVLAEKFSACGVPVFMADVKGDLSGIANSGKMTEKFEARLKKLGLEPPVWTEYPTLFWDVFGKQGHPVRTTLSELGPMMLARLLDLNETQSSVMQILFKIADDANLLVLDIKDLKALLSLVQEDPARFKQTYGHLSTATLGAIQRGLITLEERGAKDFFGEPALEIQDLMQIDRDGRGFINILAADKLLLSPTVYTTFLLWLLSELFENLPEVGDLDKPKLVFFFDEAHLLFKDAPKALLEKVEQVVRLIRSKGVGVYFVTQNPLDIPEAVLGQLAHRVQHALRAFTPVDQKAVKVAAQTMRPNPAFSSEEVISQLGVGEALISVLDPSGAPTIVERAHVLPPASQIGPIDDKSRQEILASSPLAGHYEKAFDRVSAFEVLSQRQTAENVQAPAPAASTPNTSSVLGEILFGTTGPRGGRRPGLVEKAATSATRSIATSVGREIARGILGSFLGGSRSRRRR